MLPPPGAKFNISNSLSQPPLREKLCCYNTHPYSIGVLLKDVDSETHKIVILFQNHKNTSCVPNICYAEKEHPKSSLQLVCFSLKGIPQIEQ